MSEETTIEMHTFGHSECRTWLEAEMTQGGSIRLVGMGSITKFNADGDVISHKCEPTGAVMFP